MIRHLRESRLGGIWPPGGVSAPPLSLEGTEKQALETGRNRLVVAGAVIAFAFVAIAFRLVDIAVLKGGEPRIARSTPPHAATARGDIV
ncbi:MAG: hypothetical protein FJX42_01155, partial [Alphaproteobacteria bacterium]|nr:hypothetical protein [Alphaproteobacteria bacterium]